MEPPISIISDEPAITDKLHREIYARTFARLAETCETPLVIGIYGSWGTGKTTLMRLIAQELNPEFAAAVWFNLWEHQFDENPIVALSQTLGEIAGGTNVKEIRKLLVLVATAFGGRALKSATGLSVTDLLALGTRYEEERFEVREARHRLHDHLRALVAAARQFKGHQRRLVFFIDDVDRCMPRETLLLLEALKLYLNIEGCIHFLAVDRQVLETSIRTQYAGQNISDTDYLDKMIQLPFTVPMIEPRAIGDFISPMLSSDLLVCKDLLIKGLGDNPRLVKRFINTLTFNHNLARLLGIPKYNPRLLSFLLLLQDIKPEVYRNLVRTIEDKKSMRYQELADACVQEPRLAKTLSAVGSQAFNGSELTYYVYLTKTNIGLAADLDLPPLNRSTDAPLHGRYVLWVDDNGVEGVEGIARELQVLGVSLSVVTTSEAAEQKIRAKHPDVVVSDIGRGEDHDAGLVMASEFREKNIYSGQYYFYCGDTGHGRIARAQAVGGMIFVERDPLIRELKEYLALHAPQARSSSTVA